MTIKFFLNIMIALISMILIARIWAKFAEMIGDQIGFGRFFMKWIDRRSKILKAIEEKTGADKIKLEVVDDSNIREFETLSVHETQMPFISSFDKCKSEAYSSNVHLLGIYFETMPIGYIMIRSNPDHKNHFIWQFMIDKKYQGLGNGRKALIKAIHWIINRNKYDEIVTTAIEGNQVSEYLFKSLGFKQMGETLDGETDFIMKTDDYIKRMNYEELR